MAPSIRVIERGTRYERPAGLVTTTATTSSNLCAVWPRLLAGQLRCPLPDGAGLLRRSQRPHVEHVALELERADFLLADHVRHQRGVDVVDDGVLVTQLPA